MANKFRKQRRAMWLRDPHCYWCGVRTFLPKKGEKSPKAKNEATIDHLRPRHHPDRLEPAKGEFRRVLSCWECNNKRDQVETAALPKEWFYSHGGSLPSSFQSLEELKRIEQLILTRLPKRKSMLQRSYRNLITIRAVIKMKESQAGT